MINTHLQEGAIIEDELSLLCILGTIDIDKSRLLAWTTTVVLEDQHVASSLENG